MNTTRGTGSAAGMDRSRNRRLRNRCYVMGLVATCAAVVVGIAVPAPAQMHPAAENVSAQGVGGWDGVCVALTSPLADGVGGLDSVCLTLAIRSNAAPTG